MRRGRSKELGDELINLQLRLPPELHAELKQFAEKELRSLNSQIIWFLTQALNNDKMRHSDD
jgi:hypothetical protein